MSAVRDPAPVGLGIVGCGGAALDVCDALDRLPEVRLVAVHDRARELAEGLAAPRGAAVHDSLDALLADPGVEAVYVALPHDLLAPVSEQALLAGRHVLVEKPMALDPATALRVGRLAASRGLVLGVAFQSRASAPVIEARRLVAAGAIGEIRAARIRTVIDKPPDYWRRGPSGRSIDDWRGRQDRSGGGVVLMNSIHQLDVLRFVTGLEVDRVSGEVARFVPGVEVEDAAAATLRLTNGAIASLSASAHSPGAAGDETIEIDGSEGRLDLPDAYAHGRLRVFLRGAAGTIPSAVWTEVAEPAGDGHIGLLRAFASAVRSGTTPLAGAADAAAALAIVRAIYRASASGRAVRPGGR